MNELQLINEKTRLAYNKAAELYYELFADELESKVFDREMFDEFERYLLPNGIILDAGCGPCGHVAKYFNSKGFNVTGIDISERCIELARSTNPSISFQTGDIASLKFKDNYFDAVISYYSLIDTPKKYIRDVLQELKRVLKPGGYLLLAVKEGDNDGFQNELLGIETEIYFTSFRSEEIEEMLITSGMEIIKVIIRPPYTDEIKVNRIFSISHKRRKE